MKKITILACLILLLTVVAFPATAALNHISVTYQVYDNFRGYFLPNVTDTQDYAGIFGNAVSGVYANLSQGNITYKVHTLGGQWLPEVVNRTDYAGIMGRAIDGLMVKTDTGRVIHYRVHVKSGYWLSYISGYNQNDAIGGYAGIFGQEIDAVQMYLEDMPNPATPAPPTPAPPTPKPTPTPTPTPTPVLVTPTPAQANTNTTTVVAIGQITGAKTGSVLDIRSKPTTSASVVERLGNAYPVSVLAEQSGWTKIGFDKKGIKTGWVKSSYVKRFSLLPLNTDVYLISKANGNSVTAFLSEAPSIPLRAKSKNKSTWEVCRLVPTTDGYVCIRFNANRKYVWARVDKSGIPLEAASTNLGQWERFSPVPTGSNWGFKSKANGNCISTLTSTSGAPLAARYSRLQSWETFVIEKATKSTPPTPIPQATISISEASMPTGSMYEGSTFSISGNVTASENLTSLTAGVYQANGAPTSEVMTVTPNTKSYSLSGAVDHAIHFNWLAVGSYVYKVTATAGNTSKELACSAFSVRESPFLFPVPGYEFGDCGVNCGCEIHKGRHNGGDISTGGDFPTVYAVHDGTITTLDRDIDSRGNCITINNGAGINTTYMHLSTIDPSIYFGKPVKRGEPIGRVGSTGDSKGNHLHLELRIGGELKDPKDYIH